MALGVLRVDGQDSSDVYHPCHPEIQETPVAVGDDVTLGKPMSSLRVMRVASGKLQGFVLPLVLLVSKVRFSFRDIVFGLARSGVHLVW